MKKIQLFLAFICYVLSFFTVEAKRVDIEKAEKVARSYARTTTRLTAYRDVRLSKTVSRRVSRPRPEVRSTAAQPQDEPMFYVFAMNGNGGFVIVSGDDIAKPVLGYSGDGTYDENNPNLAYWMETLSQEIAGAIENNVSQDEQTKADWEAFESESDSDISAVSQSGGDYVKPLVKTAWSQNEPYNNLCPEVSGTRTVTGCVATAMAQIMKYHEHPATRTVTIPGYTTRKYRINISGIDGTFDYRWDEMTGTYTSSSASTSQAAVAELMYHCGVSVKMDYDLPSVGSAAYSSDIVSALQDYFGYDAGIACHDREYCTYTEWINLLKAEIKANRPVYYSGSSSSSGHAFVCDGYTGDLFHFNWGWGGSSDGYFEISALNPKSTGIGGNSEGYNQDQKIVTGIQPDKGGQPSIQLGLSRFYTSKTSLNSLTESFFLTAEILMNTGIVSITDVYLGVLLYSHDDSYIDYKTAQKSPGLNFGQYYSSYELLSSYTFPSNLPAGTYKLYPAYSISGEIPAIIPGKNGNKYIIVVVKNDGTVTLSESSSTAPVNAQTPTISVQPQPAVYPFGATATALSVTANVTDGGVLSYQWYNNAADNNTGGLGIDGATSANYTPPTNTTGTVYYYVKVTNTNTGADITGSQTAVITSSTAAITVSALVDAQTPTISVQPQPAVYPFDATATALSVTANVTDGGVLSYQWYNNAAGNNTGGLEIDGATSANYTPPTNTTGTVYYYVKVTNTNTGADITGSQTAVITSSTAAITVNAPVDAQTPTISVQPQPAVYTLGATATALSVTANVTDGGVLSYQWYNNAAGNNTGGLEIDGATSANYTPPTNTTGTVYYYVKVTNTNTGADITGSQTAVITSSTAAITVNKASQSAPGAPTFAGKTATGITLNTISGNVEYSKDGQIWQDSPVFDNLTPNTAYTFYARYKETGTHTASVSSGPSETITTDKATLSGKVMVSGTVVFGETLTAVTSALKSEPAVENLGTISYQWKRDGSEITGATGSTCTLVQEDIAAIITVTVTTDNTQGSVDSEATTPVAKAQQAAPGPPLLASKTATSVTLNATQSNVEYSIDGVNWQDSPVFDGLSPDTYYTFYMRTKETATHNISPASEGLTVVTDLSTDAELVSLMINGNPVSIADNELNYQATCDENSVTLNIEPSIAASVTVTVGEVEYQSNQSIPLSGDLTEIRINIVSQDKKTLNEYILTVANPFDANRALFKRWDDVVAVNRNRNSNISGVRWHINGETEVSQEWYIQITGEYYAEINIADKWRWVCGNPETISGKLTAYPNPVPAGENLTLKLPVNFTGGYMDVISLAGSTVKRKLPLPDTTNVLSVADWMPGIYLLNIVAPDGCRETIKIVISD